MRQSRGHVCQRPNIGSRVNREVHARFWERAEVRFLRATRHSRRFRPIRARIAVGTRVTSRPPHRSAQAGFPHAAPTLGI